MKKQVQMGVGNATSTVKGFIDAWKRAERGEKVEAEQRLYFENLETLLKTLTAGRWVLLKTLRTNGPMSVRTLAGALGRDYKNVHTDVSRLEQIGLIGRTKDEKIESQWDCSFWASCGSSPTIIRSDWHIEPWLSMSGPILRRCQDLKWKSGRGHCL